MNASRIKSTGAIHASRCSLEKVCEAGRDSDGYCKRVYEQAKDFVQETPSEEMMGTTNQPNYKKKPKPAKNNAPKLPKK